MAEAKGGIVAKSFRAARAQSLGTQSPSTAEPRAGLSRSRAMKGQGMFGIAEVLAEKDIDEVQVPPAGITADEEIEAGSDESLMRLEGYRSLVSRAVDVFGDETTASRWLSTPSAELENLVPLQVARNHGYDGATLAQLFEPIFTRIEHGIYS